MLMLLLFKIQSVFMKYTIILKIVVPNTYMHILYPWKAEVESNELHLLALL